MIGRSVVTFPVALGWLRGTQRTPYSADCVLDRGASAHNLTHAGALETLQSIDPTIRVIKKRFVDDGVITSAGISAGIDMALYAVEELHGAEVSNDTAAYMEY